MSQATLARALRRAACFRRTAGSRRRDDWCRRRTVAFLRRNVSVQVHARSLKVSLVNQSTYRRLESVSKDVRYCIAFRSSSSRYSATSAMALYVCSSVSFLSNKRNSPE